MADSYSILNRTWKGNVRLNKSSKIKNTRVLRKEKWLKWNNPCNYTTRGRMSTQAFFIWLWFVVRWRKLFSILFFSFMHKLPMLSDTVTASEENEVLRIWKICSKYLNKNNDRLILGWRWQMSKANPLCQKVQTSRTKENKLIIYSLWNLYRCKYI